jgi:hypothetical protein
LRADPAFFIQGAPFLYVFEYHQAVGGGDIFFAVYYFGVNRVEVFYSKEIISEPFPAFSVIGGDIESVAQGRQNNVISVPVATQNEIPREAAAGIEYRPALAIVIADRRSKYANRRNPQVAYISASFSYRPLNRKKTPPLLTLLLLSSSSPTPIM